MIRKWIIGIILLVIAGIGAYLWLQPKAGIIGPVNLNTTLLAFDYDGLHGTVTLDRLLEGDGVFLLRVLDDKNAYFFSSFKQLQDWDRDKTGFIDLTSKDINQLYVGRYIQNYGWVEYKSVQNAGIAAITLKYVDGKIHSAVIVLNDNTKRNLDSVAINDGFLLTAKLKKSSSLGI